MLSLSFSHSTPAPTAETIPANPSSGRSAAGAQPEPTGLFLNQIQAGGAWVTSITREWSSAKAARGNCRLCPRADCVVSPRGVCNVMVVGKVDEDDAWLYARPDAPAAHPAAPLRIVTTAPA